MSSIPVPKHTVLVDHPEGLAMKLVNGSESYLVPLAVLADEEGEQLFYQAANKLEAGDLSFLDDWKQYD